MVPGVSSPPEFADLRADSGMTASSTSISFIGMILSRRC